MIDKYKGNDIYIIIHISLATSETIIKNGWQHPKTRSFETRQLRTLTHVQFRNLKSRILIHKSKQNCK